MTGTSPILGANYPWTLVNGVHNYGRDFGAAPNGVHTGVSTRRDIVDADFAAMRDLGLTVVRWFAFCDGRAGIAFDERRMPRGLAPGVFEDFDAALELAGKHGLRLMPVLLDYLWMYDTIENRDPAGNRIYRAEGFAHVIKSAEGRELLLGRVFVPLFDRYARSAEIVAWDIMNEPDWVIAGLAPDPRTVTDPMAFDRFSAFVRAAADEVHERTDSLVTVGSARANHVAKWEEADCALDLLQVHAYEDFWKQGHDRPIRGRNPAELGARHPVIVGEFPVNGEPMNRFVDAVIGAGFAGALFWSFNNVDRCGVDSLESLKEILADAAPLALGASDRNRA